MVLWFLRFGPKSLIWPLLGLLAASVLASHFRRMLISKNHKFPMDFAQNAFFGRSFWLQVGSKSGVLVDAKNAPGCSFFAFLSILKSIEIRCIARGAFRAARASIRPHPGSKSGLPECHLDPSWRSKRLSFLSIACRLSYLSFVIMIIKSNLYYCMSFTSSLFVTTIFNSNLSCCMLFVFVVATIANIMIVRFGLHHYVLRITAVAFAVLKTILNAAHHAGYLAGNPPEHRRRLT